MHTNYLRENDVKVDVIIPTYHSDDKFIRLIEMLYRQTKKPNRILILQTREEAGEEQALPEIADDLVEVIPIEKEDFDHGGTRKFGASLSDAQILVFMTQDAIPEDEYLLEHLLKPYEDPKVAATYARQLAGNEADLLERFTRNFNYPKTSRVKSLEDLDKLGIKTFFCSNVCASYRKDVFCELGGFVDKTIFNEDMIYASGLIRNGYKIAYVAEARVIHSHQYSYHQQFTRNFDLGVSHKQYASVFQGTKSESEGIKLVKKSLEYLIKKKKYLLIPDLIISSGMKYLGYQLGLHYDKLPEELVIRFSMNRSYWRK
ncbi:MAG TPA: glycosyltransferase family 2 protein [Clostridiales bacterium]|mgnify:CR=1 FL=1|nr:glycosyltransferase family 2 protein [Clostridiales bacterium]